MGACCSQKVTDEAAIAEVQANANKNSANDMPEGQAPPLSEEELRRQKLGHIPMNRHREALPMNIERPPIIKLDDDTLIFLYDLKSGAFKFRIWSFRRDRLMSKSKKIQPLLESDAPMIFNSVYAFHAQQKKIYFIVKNERVVTLSIETQQLEEIGRIHTTMDNVAALSYLNGEMYILGAEEIDPENDEGKVESAPVPYCTLVPYSTCVKQSKGDAGRSRAESIVERIKAFGAFTRVMNYGHEIWLMGGQANVEGRDTPSDNFFVYDTKAKEWLDHRFLIYPLRNMAVINMDNKYLLTFGGERRKGEEDTRAVNNLYALALEDGLEGGLEKHKWYECNMVDMPIECCGVLMEGDTLIHLFTRDGVHWTIPTHEIYSRLMVEHCKKKNVWREQGKTVLPTKSKSITNMGPKLDSDDSDSE